MNPLSQSSSDSLDKSSDNELEITSTVVQSDEKNNKTSSAETLTTERVNEIKCDTSNKSVKHYPEEHKPLECEPQPSSSSCIGKQSLDRNQENSCIESAAEEISKSDPKKTEIPSIKESVSSDERCDTFNSASAHNIESNESSTDSSVKEILETINDSLLNVTERRPISPARSSSSKTSHLADDEASDSETRSSTDTNPISHVTNPQIEITSEISAFSADTIPMSHVTNAQIEISSGAETIPMVHAIKHKGETISEFATVSSSSKNILSVEQSSVSNSDVNPVINAGTIQNLEQTEDVTSTVEDCHMEIENIESSNSANLVLKQDAINVLASWKKRRISSSDDTREESQTCKKESDTVDIQITSTSSKRKRSTEAKFPESSESVVDVINESKKSRLDTENNASLHKEEMEVEEICESPPGKSSNGSSASLDCDMSESSKGSIQTKTAFAPKPISPIPDENALLGPPSESSTFQEMTRSVANDNQPTDFINAKKLTSEKDSKTENSAKNKDLQVHADNTTQQSVQLIELSKSSDESSDEKGKNKDETKTTSENKEIKVYQENTDKQSVTDISTISSDESKSSTTEEKETGSTSECTVIKVVPGSIENQNFIDLSKTSSEDSKSSTTTQKETEITSECGVVKVVPGNNLNQNLKEISQSSSDDSKSSKSDEKELENFKTETIAEYEDLHVDSDALSNPPVIDISKSPDESESSTTEVNETENLKTETISEYENMQVDTDTASHPTVINKSKKPDEPGNSKTEAKDTENRKTETISECEDMQVESVTANNPTVINKSKNPDEPGNSTTEVRESKNQKTETLTEYEDMQVDSDTASNRTVINKSKIPDELESISEENENLENSETKSEKDCQIKVDSNSSDNQSTINKNKMSNDSISSKSEKVETL